MEESSTYQAILRKGRLEDRRESLIEAAETKFGPSPPEVATVVQAITDFERLRRMTRRVIEATDWNDLLSTP